MGALEVTFLILAILALALPFIIARITRPRIDIETRAWTPANPVPWTFAVVSIRNRPLARLLRPVLVRQVAAGCTVILEFRRGGELAIPEVPARWSSRPEPLKLEPILPGGSAPATSASVSSSGTSVSQVRFTYEPSIVPQTITQDLAPGRWEEVAVAILHHGGDAFAWGAESYAYPGGGNPSWKLERAIYEVTVRAESSGISTSQTFKLDNLATDFARFKPTSI